MMNLRSGIRNTRVHAKRASRRFAASVAAALVLLLVLGACSDDNSGNSSVSEDAAIDAGSDGADALEVGRDGLDADADDADDADDAADAAKPDPGDEITEETLARIASHGNDTKLIDDRYALEVSRKITGSSPAAQHTFAFILDLDDPENVKYTDVRIEGELKTFMQGTTVDERVVLVTSEQASSNSDEIRASSFRVSEGEFQLIEEIDVEPPEGELCTILDVVSNDTEIAVVCLEAIIELEMSDRGELDVSGQIDLRDVDGRENRRYHLPNQYAMTPEGLIVEVEKGVRMFRLPSTTLPSDPEDDTQVEAVVGLLEIDDLKKRWAYAADKNLLYLPGANSMTTDSNTNSRIVDISDPQSPEIVSSLNLQDHLGIYARHARGVAVNGERLFVSFGTFNGTVDDVLCIFDIGEDGTQMETWKTLTHNDIPGPGRSAGNLFVHDERLFLAYDGAIDVDVPTARYVGHPLSHFENDEE